MPFLENTDETIAQGLPAWLPDAVLWLGLAGVFLGLVAAVGVWTLVARMRGLLVAARKLEGLDELNRKLALLASGREDLDLRRIEHVLIDLRDSQRRLEDALLRTVEALHAPASGADELIPAAPLGPIGIGDRVVNRLLALGYSRIELQTSAEELAGLTGADGEVRFEAKKSGAFYKGRIQVRAGRLSDVEVKSAYTIFP